MIKKLYETRELERINANSTPEYMGTLKKLDFKTSQEQTTYKLKFSERYFNSFLASDDFCPLLITFANSLDPDQDRQNVGPDLDLNSLNFERIF